LDDLSERFVLGRIQHEKADLGKRILPLDKTEKGRDWAVEIVAIEENVVPNPGSLVTLTCSATKSARAHLSTIPPKGRVLASILPLPNPLAIPAQQPMEQIPKHAMPQN
jgi:hypothetical protein